MTDSEEKFFESLARSTHHGSLSKNRKTDDDGDRDDNEVQENDREEEALSRSRTPAKRDDQATDSEPEGQLTIDVYQTPNDIVIESAVAGVKPEDLDITVTNDSVTIKGHRRRDHAVKDEDYFYQECYWGRFSRSVILPQEVDADNASVTFKNGVLIVRLPKIVKQKMKKLKVKIE